MSDILQDALNHLDEGFTLWDSGARLVAWNKALVEMLGWPEELVQQGTHVSEMTDYNARQGDYGARDLDEIKKERLQIMSDPQRRTYLKHRPGVGVIEMNHFPTENGGLIITYRDVTSRECAKHELEEGHKRLKESEARLKAIIGHSPDSIQLKDTDGRYSVVSRRFEEWFGGAEGSWLGKTVYDVFPKDVADGMIDRDNEALAGKKVIQRELELPFVDGTIHQLMITKFPVSDTDGKALGVGTITTDVTEQVRARDALRESEAHFRAIADHSPDLIVLKDLKGRYLLTNRELENRYGVEEGNWLGKTDYDLMPKERADAINALDKKVLSTDSVIHSELVLPFLDGAPHNVQFTKFPVKSPDGQILGVGTIASDVTELRNTEDQLRQAQRMEAVGELAGGIAHEFNNLLMAVGGSLEYLSSHLPADDDRLQKMLDIARRSTKRGAELTDRMLSYGRKQILRPEILDLNETVTHSVELLRPTLGETIRIETALAEEVWTSELDRGQMETALLSLAVNAREAMPQGGTLTFATANFTLDAAYAKAHPDTATGDYVLVTVTDTGTGMPPEVVERAFEPFFTTKDVGEGSGLGLSMVHGFSKQSGGHAEIDSAAGKGTSIKLYFPRAEKQTVAAQEQAGEAPAVAGAGKTALVVEDDALVRGVVLEVVAELGYTVIEAEDGAAALASFNDHPEIALVLTDVIMPGDISGIELARQIQQHNPQTKIVLMSGYPRGDIETRGPSLSGLQVLRKPFDRADLIRVLRQD